MKDLFREHMTDRSVFLLAFLGSTTLDAMTSVALAPGLGNGSFVALLERARRFFAGGRSVSSLDRGWERAGVGSAGPRGGVCSLPVCFGEQSKLLSYYVFMRLLLLFSINFLTALAAPLLVFLRRSERSIRSVE